MLERYFKYPQVLSLTLAILEKRSSGQLNTTSSKTPVSSAAR